MLNLILTVFIIVGICINSILEWTILYLLCILYQTGQAKTWGRKKNKNMPNWRIGYQRVQRFSFFFFFTLCFPPNPMLRCLKEVLLIRQTTLIFPLKLYLPVCLSLCDCWNIISYFFMSVRALGQGLGAWILYTSIFLLRVFTQRLCTKDDSRRIVTKVPAN